MKLFTRRVLVKHRARLPRVSAHSHGKTMRRDLTRGTTRRGRKGDEGRLRGIGSFFFFFARGIFRRIVSAKKLRGNTRGVISEMETCSLACAGTKETFLSRKNNMHRARGVFYVHASYLLFNIYNVLFYCRGERSYKTKSGFFFELWHVPRELE
jgi:hypothetical protein